MARQYVRHRRHPEPARAGRPATRRAGAIRRCTTAAPTRPASIATVRSGCPHRLSIIDLASGAAGQRGRHAVDRVQRRDSTTWSCAPSWWPAAIASHPQRHRGDRPRPGAVARRLRPHERAGRRCGCDATAVGAVARPRRRPPRTAEHGDRLWFGSEIGRCSPRPPCRAPSIPTVRRDVHLLDRGRAAHGRGV